MSQHRTLDHPDTIHGIRAAIKRTSSSRDYYQNRMLIARHLGNPERQRHCAERATAYDQALGRLEELADKLGLFQPCCQYALAGDFCDCP